VPIFTWRTIANYCNKKKIKLRRSGVRVIVGRGRKTAFECYFFIFFKMITLFVNIYIYIYLLFRAKFASTYLEKF
jgi:hypothetical protein